MTGFKANELCKLLEGFYLDDFKPISTIYDFEIDASHIKTKKGTCFISISNERWNQVHQKKTTWKDGNEAIQSHHTTCALIITETPIKQLRNKIPQLIVDNSYMTIHKLAKTARLKMVHPVIGITGSVGKSSTRLLMEHILRDTSSIVATRGNHNTQVGVPLYGTKLCQNPEIGILEISLNALNNRGNQSIVIQPDICIVTSIGEAHLTTLHSTKNIAKFKARIFHGLKPNGLAIINQDIHQDEFQILYNEAKKKTDRIRTYSCTDKNADLYLKDVILSKYKSSIIFHYQNNNYHFEIKLPSSGMIENALAVFLCLAEMGYDLHPLLSKTYNFQSLNRVMELKQLKTKDGRHIDVIDDSHNAAIPSMKNAIRTFHSKQAFYKGKKLLVLGQVADLGEKSEALHQELFAEILTSGADYIFGHGKHMRNIIKPLPSHMIGGWFNNARDLASHIPLYCSDDSLILLKGSVTGSDFRSTSYLLPNKIAHSTKQLNRFDPESITDALQPIYGAIVYSLIDLKKKVQLGSPLTTSLEGLSPIILFILLLKKDIRDNTVTSLKNWATNKGASMHQKAFTENERFSHKELMEELLHTQHPSAIFQLANMHFGKRNNALIEIEKFAKEITLSPSSTLNLTGRYRVKEQQSFRLTDLYKLGVHLAKYQSMLPTIPIDKKHFIKGICFGRIRLSFIGFLENDMICITGVKSKDECVKLLTRLTRIVSKKNVAKGMNVK